MAREVLTSLTARRMIPYFHFGSEAGMTGTTGVASRIGGLSILKGAVLYGATLTFAGLYADFMEQIFTATNGKPPVFDTAMVSAAAALSGVLGSAFALVIGVPTTQGAVNVGLFKAIQTATSTKDKLLVFIRRILSLDPGGTDQASWPMTFGIWVYAAVAAAVAITYFLNQNETPDALRTLAIAFGGYAVALVTAAYGLAR